MIHGNLIDHIEYLLERMIHISEELGNEKPAAVRINPEVLREISRIPHWFQHPLFYVQDAGVRGHGPNATEHSPVINRVFVHHKALPIMEDPNTYLVSLDYRDGIY